MFAALGIIEVSGVAVNISKIRALRHALDGGCNVYQCSQPPMIHTTRSCFEIMEEIEWVLDQNKS